MILESNFPIFVDDEQDVRVVIISGIHNDV